MINAGGSFGQFVFAPLLQTLISLLGWMGAMWSLAVISLGGVAAGACIARIASTCHAALPPQMPATVACGRR